MSLQSSLFTLGCTAQVVAHQVPDWRMVKQNRHQPPHRQIWDSKDIGNDRSSPKTSKVNKAKGLSSGRTYTSKYRGVHQTFPTRRWEAQFRCDITLKQCVSKIDSKHPGVVVKHYTSSGELWLHIPCR